MTKEQALKLIDNHKNKLVDPGEMLDWVWLRVIVLQIESEAWENAVAGATKILSA